MTSTFQPTDGPLSPTSLGPLAPAKKQQPKKPPPPPQRGAPFKPAQPVQPEQPAQAAPLEKPDPVLQQHGFNGGIHQFNTRVQKVVDTYKTSYGTAPPPNLVFDIALSKVPDGNFGDLFTVPLNQTAAVARQSLNQHPADQNLVVRHDGNVEQNNPVRQLLVAQPSKTVAQYQKLQTAHPWVAAGMLPLPGKQLSSFWDAVQFAQNHPGATKPLTVGGESLAQYQQENRIGESLTGSSGAETPGLYSTSLTGKPTGSNTVAEARFIANRETVAKNVSTVKQAQDKLKQIAPAFFTGLPSSGFINQDWAKAIGKYQSSAQYFRQQTVQLATDNHFGSNTAAFIHAWQAKQAAIKKQPLLAAFLQHQPLAFFDYRTHGAAVVNLFSGNTKGWGWANVPTWGLSAITHVASTAIDELAGTVDQAKIDASYVSAYMQAITPKNSVMPGLGITGLGMTEKQARAHAAKVLQKNPSWARVFDPAVGTDEDPNLFASKTAPIFNTAVDLLIGAPKFTGERVGAGDIAATKASRYFNAKTEFAYNALKEGKIGEATQSLEGGLGAERLNALLEETVKSGDTSLAQYQHHASELFSHGRTVVGHREVTPAIERGETPELPAKKPKPTEPIEVSGALLRSLRTRDLPTPGAVRMAAQEIHAKVRSLTDQYEDMLRARKQQGATSHAANFISSVRQLTARAAPAGERRYLFDERLPQDTYNWARTQLKASPSEAAGLRDQLIRLRSQNDIQGITELFDSARARFLKEHPTAEIKPSPVETGGPEIESESRSYLYFPAALDTRAQRISAGLNKIGKAHRETIVGGSPVPLIPSIFAGVPGFGESLFYKHTVADTTRRVIGGGGVFPVAKDARKLVDSYLRENPAAIRDVGVARSAAKTGETRWITGEKPTDPLSFRTGDTEVAGKNGAKVTRKQAMVAAGGYLRRNLSSDALKAFQQSSEDNLGPLMDLITNNETFRNLAFKDVRTFTPSKEWQKIPDGIALPAGGELMERNNVRYVRWQTPPPAIRVGGQTTSEAAEALYRRYKEIEDAGVKAGVADPLNEALDVLVKNAGPSADKKLGEWLDKNGIDMPVRDGLVEQKQWDDVMQKWIGKLMTANKWNRGQLFDHVFYGTVKDLVDHGWETADAIPVSADLAKAQTVYHMLDFSNMLQVEQNLRWLSYFATKHRLYWTWILKQAVQRPGLAAAVSDVKDHLDQYGNLNFRIYGHDLYVPAARLFWVNATEYPQTSPIVQFVAEAAKGAVEGEGTVNAVAGAYSSLTSTSGNLITRDDQAELLASKLALMSAGRLPATADAVTEGMPSGQAKQFNASVNEYAVLFHQQHGDWPNEADAVKHVLLHETARQFWSTNLFLPVLWNGEGAPSAQTKKELDTYSKIVNPAKKSAYLDAHPDVALRFGVSTDPAVFLHNNQLWDKFNAAEKQVTAARQQIYQQILAKGFTPAISKEMSALSARWSATIDQLKLDDATNWAGSPQYPAGKVSDGKIVQPGPWGIQLEGDPFASRAFVTDSFPGIPKPQLNAHTVGARIVALQDEAATLRAAKTPAQITALGYTDAQAVNDRLSAINQILAPFFAYPKDAPSKLQSAYYDKYVVPYQKERDAKTAAIALAPEDQQDALRSELRAWKDDHDHPVEMTFEGHKIKFPSVVQIGWAKLPDEQRHLGLAQAVVGDWAHIASYEKTLMGVKTSAAVSQGWSLYATTVRDYSKDPSHPSLVKSQRTDIAKQIDRYYPGFYKDYLFAQQPKLDRFMATDLYRQMPKDFYTAVVQPAQQFIREIKQNGHRTYYEKAWRNAVETQLMPYIDTDPKLKAALAPYGPNFLNTLVSTSG